jgi:histone arginine demethylase JMJD6
MMLAEELQVKPKYKVISGIDRRTNLSQDEFISDYVKLSRPVVLTDAAKDWKAMKKFTPQWFKEHYSHINKNINGVDYNMGDRR